MRRRLTLIGTVMLVVTVSTLAAPPYPPENISGSLVIVGGGKLPESVRLEMIRLAKGKDQARLVVIPTASASADKIDEHESFLKPWKDAGVKTVQLLHTRDRKIADDPKFVKPIIEATAVWFSGGDQSRITTAYLGTLVEKELNKLLGRGGAIGGTSAGAAIMSDLMIESGNPEAKTGPGFGFLPGVVIDQHFTQRNRLPRLRGVLDKNPGYVGIGIDEQTAIIVQGRSIDVLGQGTATICWAKSGTQSQKEETFKQDLRKVEADLVQIRRAAMARIAMPEFPGKDVKETIVPKGGLVIVGGGGTTQAIMDRFFELAGGKDSLIVVVPTANEQEVIPDDPGDAKYLRKWGATNVKVLHTRNRRQADDPQFSQMLVDAKGVWFGGGRQWRFIDAYEGTIVEKRFRSVLERGGVIGGSSAGASIQSEYMPRGHPLGNMVMDAEGYERGFGYLPGAAVDQHFFARKRTRDMTGLMKRYPQLLGIGIDEATAIVVTGTTAEVVGKSQVAFYDYRKGPPTGDTDYTVVSAGGKYDLKNRAVIK